MKYCISKLLDLPKLQAILDNLYVVSGIPSAIINLEGAILTGSGWQDLCTKFYRVNPETEKLCLQSDRTIAEGLEDGQRNVQITCPHGLTDTATPIIIEGTHIANIFTGQLFLQPPDREYFRRQASIYGFDEASYLAAVDQVPVITQEKLDDNLAFIAKMTELLAIQGLTQLRSLELQTSLKESEERLHQIIATAREGIIVYDLDLRVQVWNQYMEQLSGYSASEVLGRHCLEVFPFLREVGQIERLHLILSGATADPSEFPFNLPEKSKFGWASDTSGPLRNAEGKIVGVIGTVRDITEHLKTEEQLRQALKMESVGRLAGGVAHDFNNMLTVILGQAELAKLKLPETDRLWQHLDQIETAAERSSTITRQLLAFSRKEVIDPRPVNLNDLITETWKTLLRLIEEDIALNYTPADDLWPVKIDPSQVDQIMVNLAVNARDAMHDGGILSVCTCNIHMDDESCKYLHESVSGDYVRLTISDSGTGMGQDVLDHIFEPFFTTKEQGKGTGLGLATVYGIVRQNGGFINVYSEVGQGTTFNLYFPRLHGATSTVNRNRTAIVQRGTGNVLLVEDNDMVRQVTSSYLEQIGYQVIPAHNPQSGIALSKNRAIQIDIILTDVVMPGMSGKEMLDQIASIRPGIKSLFMSGYTADLVAKRGVIEEGMHFIQKPFDMSTLSAKIKEALTEVK